MKSIYWSNEITWSKSYGQDYLRRFAESLEAYAEEDGECSRLS